MPLPLTRLRAFCTLGVVDVFSLKDFEGRLNDGSYKAFAFINVLASPALLPSAYSLAYSSFLADFLFVYKYGMFELSCGGPPYFHFLFRVSLLP